jgi:hypothetical protein
MMVVILVLRVPFALWTREAVRDLIHIKFGIRYGLGMVGRLLRRWGFTPQKPVTRAYERDDAKIRAWVKREYPVLHRRAQRENAEIYWEDETGCAAIIGWVAATRRVARHR